MIGLAAGHSIKHFYQQAFLLLIPSVKTYLGLSDVEVGILGTARTISSAAINLPAGIIADMWRSKVALMLAASLTALALGYLIIGSTPSYWVLLIGVTITGSGASLWHAPAFGTLATLYPQRRATAFAVHRMGGSIGDSASPIIIGLSLGGFGFLGLEWAGLGWRALAFIMVAPAMIGAVAVFFFFRNMEGGGGDNPSLRAYLQSSKSLFTNPTVMSMVLLSGMRAMVHNGLNIFLIIYMSEDLGFSNFKIGYHVTLLTLLGIASAPFIGWTADKIGRRPVIFFSMASLAILSFSLLFFGTGWSFTLILACLGIFLYTVNPVILAAALDATKRGTEASGVAIMFTGSAILGAVSPIIAGKLREDYGMDGVFYFAAFVMVVVSVLSLVLPMGRRQS